MCDKFMMYSIFYIEVYKVFYYAFQYIGLIRGENEDRGYITRS